MPKQKSEITGSSDNHRGLPVPSDAYAMNGMGLYMLDAKIERKEKWREAPV